jgi:hypothetical protein
MNFPNFGHYKNTFTDIELTIEYVDKIGQGRKGYGCNIKSRYRQYFK